MLRYIIEKNGGTVEWNEDTGVATATIGDKTVEYNERVVNGRMIVDSDQLVSDFGLSSNQSIHLTNDEFYSELDTVVAFGYMYYPKSQSSTEWPNGCEYGTFIYQNKNNTFSYGEVPDAIKVNTCSLGDLDLDSFACWMDTYAPKSGRGILS